MSVLKSFIFISLLLFYQCSFAQDETLNNLKQQFVSYQKHTLQEKIYVHTDKTTYLAGEVLWFRIYDVDAAQRTPTRVSNLAYVDVLDRDNQFLVQVKVPLNGGRGTGSVLLPLGAASGNYKLRAYTAWMKNFGAEQFFQKPITIIN